MIVPALALLLAASTVQSSDANDPSGPTPAPEVIATVGPTRFTAVNFSGQTQLLVLGASNGGPTTHAVLPPYGVLRYRYPLGTVEGLWIDFASWTSDGVTHSGPIQLAELVGSDLAFVDENLVFAQHESTVQAVAPLGLVGYAPAFWRLPDALNSTHVPVPKPIDPKQGEKPPKVGDDPLEVF